jgi:hypothetical protein
LIRLPVYLWTIIATMSVGSYPRKVYYDTS